MNQLVSYVSGPRLHGMCFLYDLKLSCKMKITLVLMFLVLIYA